MAFETGSRWGPRAGPHMCAHKRACSYLDLDVWPRVFAGGCLLSPNPSLVIELSNNVFWFIRTLTWVGEDRCRPRGGIYSRPSERPIFPKQHLVGCSVQRCIHPYMHLESQLIMSSCHSHGYLGHPWDWWAWDMVRLYPFMYMMQDVKVKI